MIDIAGKMRLSQPTIAKLEKSEEAGTITLNSLRRYADALDCDLAYAIIPRSGSLEAQLHARAEMMARRIIAVVSHTMALESRGLDPERVAQQVQDLADELMRTMSPELWKETE